MVTIIFKLSEFLKQTDILQLIIDLYISSVGMLGFFLALSALLYTSYKVVGSLKVKKMILFVGICILIYFGTITDVLPWIASVILLVNGLFYLTYLFRFIYFKWKRKTVISKEEPPVSILIPAKNEELVIGQTLSYLNALEYPKEKLRIIVIDDKSDDSTKEICLSMQEKMPCLEIVYNAESLGKSISLNKVISTMDDEYVVILDADHHVPSDWLKKVLSNFTHQKIAGVQGKSTIRGYTSSLISRMCYLENLFRYEVQYSGRTIATFLGSGAIFRTACLKEVGGFDPDMLTEDLEITYRLYEKGYELAYDNNVETFDLAPPDIKNYFSQRLRWFRGHWQCFEMNFKTLLKKRNISWSAKMQLLQPMIENLALNAMLYLHALYFLSFLNILDFKFALVIYIKVTIMFLLMITACIKLRKFKIIFFIPIINYYFMFYAFPNIMAMINSWILNAKFIWVKTERSREITKTNRWFSSHQQVVKQLKK